MKMPRFGPPSVGDRVRLRGRGTTGELLFVWEERNWAFCAWDAPQSKVAPLICHLKELEPVRALA